MSRRHHVSPEVRAPPGDTGDCVASSVPLELEGLPSTCAASLVGPRPPERTDVASTVHGHGTNIPQIRHDHRGEVSRRAAKASIFSTPCVHLELEMYSHGNQGTRAWYR